MNTIEQHISRLNMLLPFRIMIREFLPADINPKAYAKIRSGASGWMDPKSGDICLYKPNLVNDILKLESQVAFLKVSRQGLSGLMGDHAYRMLCMRLGSSMMKSSQNKEELISLGNDYINNLGYIHNDKWDNVAKITGDILGLEGNYSLAESLCKGSYYFHNQQLINASNEHKFQELSSAICKSLDNITDNNSILSLGKASDVFERLGYPDIDIRLDIGTLKNFMERHSLTQDQLFANSEIFSIHDPLGVFKSHMSQKEGKEPYNLFVSNNYIPGHGYLTFGVESMNDVFKGVASGKYHNIKLRTLLFLSDYSLMQAIVANKGASIQYLRPKFDVDGTSYDVSDNIRRMYGKSAEELGYKRNAGRTAPGLTPLQQSNRLIIATNIVENFKNPMSVDKRIKLYGKKKFESMVENITEHVQEARVQKSEKPITKSVERSYKDRLKTPLDTHFSVNAIRNLNKAGIYTAMDIMSFGETKLRERFGIRVYKSAIGFLEDNKLGFNASVKIRPISEAVISGKGESELARIRVNDFINSLAAVPENVLSRSVRMPRNSSGVYFSGTNAVNLIAKTASFPRWRDCNIFLSTGELKEHGLSVLKGAIPCHLEGKKGNHELYYNLVETDYAAANPSLFDKVSQFSRQTSAEVPDYIKNLLYSFSGVPSSESVRVYDFINKVYSVNVSPNDLGPDSITLKQASAFAAREIDIKNPLERRGRKARPKDVLNDMMKHKENNVVESKQRKR